MFRAVLRAVQPNRKPWQTDQEGHPWGGYLGRPWWCHYYLSSPPTSPTCSSTTELQQKYFLAPFPELMLPELINAVNPGNETAIIETFLMCLYFACILLLILQFPHLFHWTHPWLYSHEHRHYPLHQYCDHPLDDLTDGLSFYIAMFLTSRGHGLKKRCTGLGKFFDRLQR